MTDRFVTVPDSLELPAAVKVPVARLIGPTGAAATPADLGAATAAQGAKADTAVQPDALGNTASLDVGVTTGTVMAGDDARVTSLPSTYATSAPKVYYIETWDSFFGGAGGAFPDARWTNASHLTDAGLALWATHVLTGSPIPASGAVKVVWFGDSWISQNPTVLATATTTHNATATVVVSGVAGNTSAQLIARFAADVPADADYVIVNEPGVNDVYGGVVGQTIAANLVTLVGLVRGIGAVPIIAGQVPLSEHPTYSTTIDLLMRAATATPVQYPAVGLPGVLDVLLRARSTNSQALGIGSQRSLTGASCTAFGYYAQYAMTTGNKNTAVGALAQCGLTTGVSNTALGSEAQYSLTGGNGNSAFGDAAQRVMTTGSNNAALGQGSQYAVTTGNGNTGVGTLAQFSLTTGINNAAIGKSATYAPSGVVANAHTTASYGTCVGVESGLGSTTQANYITTIGYRTTAAAAGGTAIGVDSVGLSAVSTATDEFVLGTIRHSVKVPGRFNVATRTPTGSADTQGTTGDIAWDADYLYVKTGAGWKRAALTAW